jgi:glycosyltransferase involved in cell wall biosynthesis
MLKIQILCVTMHQTDFSKILSMNIQSDVIFANQADQFTYQTKSINGFDAQMVTTNTRGVGLNRNVALTIATADILIFSDDDVVYYDGYAEKIINIFENNLSADVIIFSMDTTRGGAIDEQNHNADKQIKLVNALKHGTCKIAIRRSSLLKANVHFSELFGGGCIYSSGEDSLFIMDCFSKGLKVFTSSYVLGSTSKDTSTWFQGYNEKYFYDVGAWIAAAFPKINQLIKWYWFFRFLKLTNLSFLQIRQLVNRGIKGYQMLRPFN